MTEIPIHDFSTVKPGVATHVGLGPGRAWATICSKQDCYEHVYADDLDSLVLADARHVEVDHAETEQPVLLDEWVTREKDGVRVLFTFENEGTKGRFDPDDPDDAALLRLYVQVRTESTIAGTDSQEPGWSWPKSGDTICTSIERDAVSPTHLRKLLSGVADEIALAVREGYMRESVTDAFQHLSENELRGK